MSLILAACGGGGSDPAPQPPVNPPVTPPQTLVTVSGRVNYEFVPPNANCSGLDFAGTIVRPIRGATVQLLDASTEAVLASTVASDTGDYSFADVTASSDVRLRVLAELKKSGSPSWDVEVRDNVDTSANPVALPSRPLYAVDGSNFNTGTADVVRNLTATTGWGTDSYTGDRSAAPFAILDAIYSGMRLVLEADPNADFPALDAFWSINNTSLSGSPDDGEIGTSYYTTNPDGGAPNPSLFLLGDADSDTEEFDDHVVVHEWGHYFEDNFSRSDSIGGAHTLGESLDARLAFGEGFATALAAMSLDEPQYCDTGAAGVASGFGINAESDNAGIQGWFNELSVVTFLYDLYDTTNENGDTGSIGFAPIFATMTGPQADTPAFTSVFSFAAALRTESSLDASDIAFIDAQLSRENINPVGIDIWGGGEINNANGGQDVLPLYTELPIDGTPVVVCTNSDFDSDRDGNKLAQSRYLRFTVPSPDSFTMSAVTQPTTPPLPADDPADARDQSDPDLFVQLNGAFIAQGISGEANLEAFVTPVLDAGTYVAELQEFRFADEDTATDFPDQVCFEVTMTP